MKADYINPHQNTWHQNDFRPGERYVCDGRVFKCVTSGVNKYFHVELKVEWEDNPDSDESVWPNMQWVALNWEDDDVLES